MNPAVLGLWSVHDGQDAPLAMDEQGIPTRLGMRILSRRGDDEWSHGLLGGYTVYDHTVSMILLPLHAAQNLTEFLATMIKTRMAFACSFNYNKIFFVDTVDGSVWVFTQKRTQPFECAVPSSDSLWRGAKVRLHDLKARPELNSQCGTLNDFEVAKERWQVRMEDGSGVHLLKAENLELDGVPEPLPADGLLRWFEEYARRLDAGIYAAAALKPDEASTTHLTRGICLYPAAGMDLSHCVTRGVEVTASCVFMPENPQHGWTYSIGLRLVGTAEERGYKTCQLDVRDWYIQEEGKEAEHVHGQGVVGYFPILDDGGWQLNRETDPHGTYRRPPGFVEGAFKYQSCSGRNPSMRGQFSGTLTFVPGTKKKPTGPPFQARLDKFLLRVPDFIY